MAKKLIKKLVVTANLSEKTPEQKLQTIDDMAQAEIDNPTYVPALNPPAATVQGDVAAARLLKTKHDNAKKLSEQFLLQYHNAVDALETTVVDDWTKQIQTAPGMISDRVKVLHFGTKGVDTGSTSTIAATEKQLITASTPLIGKVNRNTAGQHTLPVHDSVSKKRKLPANIIRCDMYEQIGGTAPSNLEDLLANGGKNIGTVDKKHHHYVNVFPPKSVPGTPLHYIAVYVDKPTLKPVAQSPVRTVPI